jgi:hypothetical protein
MSAATFPDSPLGKFLEKEAAELGLDDVSAAKSWISCAHPDLVNRITPAVEAVLRQVAAESKDSHARIYTQAEVVRAIEIAASPQAAAVPEGYSQTVIDALYENGDPVSVDAAEEIQRLLAAAVPEAVARDANAQMYERIANARGVLHDYDHNPAEEDPDRHPRA